MLIASVIFSCNKKNESGQGEIKKEAKDRSEISSAGVKESGVEFKIEYNLPRKFYRIDKEDLNKDGSNEIVVLSVGKDTSEKFNDYYNFDMIEVFKLNDRRDKYIKIFTDTVDYSTDCTYEDLQENGRKQIIVKTNSGGNNTVSSKGMFLYNMNDSGIIGLIKYFDTGDPVIADLIKDGKKEIILTDEYWGVMPQVNVINYTKSIFEFQNDKLILKNRDFGKYFDEQIKILKDKYYGVKKKVEMGMQMHDMSYPLYREAAEVIVNYYSKEDMQGLKKFWDEEKESLQKNIPQDEFEDLKNFVGKAVSSEKNA